MMEGRRKGTLCIYLAVIFSIIWKTEAVTLYPYGSTNGDSVLSKADNDLARSIDLERAFPFGEKYHNLVYISDNGVISFDDAVFVEVDSGLYRNLPYYYDVDGDNSHELEQPDSVVPFWADVDITSNGGGNIYYRSDTASSITSRATTEVRKYFRSNPTFTAQEVVIVTWDEVSFYDQVGDTDPRNTFQAILIYDGQESFVFFLYAKIEWVVGTRMEGDVDTGLGESGVALVGFLSNDGGTNDILVNTRDGLLNLPTSSNLVNEESGIYAYKVDGGKIIEPSCNSGNDAAFAITPSRSGMMGGDEIYLLGPCWESIVTYTCVFAYNGQELQRINATVETINDAYCIPDPFFLVGEVDLTVEVHDSSVTYTETYSLIESGRMEPTVIRQSPDSSYWNTAGNSLTVEWDSMGSVPLTISVHAYREDGSKGPRWETVYVITNNTEDDGSYQFRPTAQNGVTDANAFGVIRITANTIKRERILWSEIHPLGYLLEEAYQEDPAGWTSEKCNEWIVADDFKGDFITENLPACPCTYQQAVQDVGIFISDPSCYSGGGSGTCSNNDGAKHCFLSAYASIDKQAGTKCCYDDNDVLMYAGDTKTAGMSGRSHVRGANPYLEQNLVPELSHWSNDRIAYHFCCMWAGDKECFEYIERRPTSDCVNYDPPIIALSFGDPHYITIDRSNYTFNGLGEFTLLRYASGPTGVFEFELQGRQTRSKDISDKYIDVTQLSSVAMKDSESDTIFIDASVSSGMDVRRKKPDDDGWSSVYFSAQTFIDMQGASIGVTKFERNVEIYGLVVMFKASGIGVQVSYDYGMLAVRPILPSDLDSDKLYGLLGNMNGDPEDDLKRRDNNQVLTDPTEREIHEFGLTWEIETDYNLFYYPGYESHSTYHNNTFEPLFDVVLTALYPLCEDVDDCLYDYTVSDKDPDLAAATLGAYNDFQESSEGIQKVDACSFVTTPYNGTKVYSSSTNHYFEGAEIAFTCEEGLILVGSPFKKCEYYSGTETIAWTGAGDDVTCFSSACGFLDTPQNGSTILNEDGTTATFECDEGYNLNGAGQSVCTAGSWTKNAPTCSAASTTNVVGIAVGVSLAVIVVILLIVLGVLYYNKNQGSKSKRTTDELDAELAEPLNKKPPTDVSTAPTKSGSSKKSNEGNTGPSAQIYKPTAISQASVKYTDGGGSSKSKPPEPVKKDPEAPQSEPKPDAKLVEAAVNPVATTADEQIPVKVVTQTESSAPPPVVPKTKTPETVRIEPPPPTSRKSSYSSTAPSYGQPAKNDAVKGTGLLQNTNISGSGGWI